MAAKTHYAIIIFQNETHFVPLARVLLYLEQIFKSYNFHTLIHEGWTLFMA